METKDNAQEEHSDEMEASFLTIPPTDSVGLKRVRDGGATTTLPSMEYTESQPAEQGMETEATNEAVEGDTEREKERNEESERNARSALMQKQMQEALREEEELQPTYAQAGSSHSVPMTGANEYVAIPTEEEISESIFKINYMKAARGEIREPGEAGLRLPQRSTTPNGRLFQPTELDAAVRSGNTPRYSSRPREESPFDGQRGRLPTRRMYTNENESRENSQGNSERNSIRSSEERSRSPAQTPKVGVVRTERTNRQIIALRACKTDHHDLNNWIITGNRHGYYAACKNCRGKLNDMMRYGPKSKYHDGEENHKGVNRVHGQRLDPRENPDHYPQDKICLSCGQKGCRPVDCPMWLQFNPNGLDRILGRPPTPDRTGSKAKSEKSSDGSSSRNTSRGGKRPSQAASSPRTKSQKTSPDLSTEVDVCSNCGEKITADGKVGCSCKEPKRAGKQQNDTSGDATSQSWSMPEGMGTPASPNVARSVPSRRNEEDGAKDTAQSSRGAQVFQLNREDTRSPPADSRTPSVQSSIHRHTEDDRTQTEVPLHTQIVLLEAKIEEMRVDSEEDQRCRKLQAEEIQRLQLTMQRAVEAERLKDEEIKERKKEAKETKRELQEKSAAADMWNKNKEMMRKNEKEVRRMGDQIIENENNYQTIVKQLNRDVQELQQKWELADEAAKMARSTGKTGEKAEITAKYEGKLKAAMDRVEELEREINETEPTQHTESRIRAECERELLEIKQRLRIETENSRTVTLEWSELKRKMTDGRYVSQEDVQTGRATLQNEVKKAGERALEAEHKLKEEVTTKDGLEKNMNKILKMLEEKKKEVKRLNEEMDKKPSNERLKKMQDAENEAEIERESNRVVAEEYALRLRNEKEIRDRLKREIELLQAKIETGTKTTEATEEIDSLRQRLRQDEVKRTSLEEEINRCRKQVQESIREARTQRSEAEDVLGATVQEYETTINCLRKAIQGEERKTEDSKLAGKRTCEQVLSEAYNEDDDPDDTVPAHHILKMLIQALHVDFKLPNYEEADEQRKSAEENLKSEVRELKKSVKDYKERTKNAAGKREASPSPSSAVEEYHVGETVIVRNNEIGTVTSINETDRPRSYKVRMANGDEVGTTAQRMKKHRRVTDPDNGQERQSNSRIPERQQHTMQQEQQQKTEEPPNFQFYQDMGTWDPSQTLKRNEKRIWHPYLKKNVICKYCTELSFEQFAGGTWQPGSMQVKGCKEITRGYFAECTNMDQMGDGDVLMFYITDIGSFILNETIPIWVKKDSMVRIFEPIVTAPISAISQLKASLMRAAQDKQLMVQTIQAELSQCIENRCEKWNARVGAAITAEVKAEDENNLVQNLMNLLYNKEEVNARSHRLHLKIADEDRAVADGEVTRQPTRQNRNDGHAQNHNTEGRRPTTNEMNAQPLRNTVAAKLYDPRQPSGYSAIGVSYKDLCSGGRVLDIHRMNQEKDDNGRRLHNRYDRMWWGNKPIDSKSVNFSDLNSRNWATKFTQMVNTLGRHAPKGWMIAYLATCHTAQPFEINQAGIPIALEEIDAIILKEIADNGPPRYKRQYDAWVATQGLGTTTGLAALAFLVKYIQAPDPTAKNQAGVIHFNLGSNCDNVDMYLEALLERNTMLHIRKPDEKACDDYAERVIIEVKMKAAQTNNIRLERSAKFLSEENDTPYEQLKKFITNLEVEVDRTAELQNFQRQKAEGLLQNPSAQISMKSIETEFQPQFVEDERGEVSLADGADLSVAVDILENPAIYMPTASNEQRLRRYCPPNRFPQNLGTTPQQHVPPTAYAAGTGTLQQQMYHQNGGRQDSGVPWDAQSGMTLADTLPALGPTRTNDTLSGTRIIDREPQLPRWPQGNTQPQDDPRAQQNNREPLQTDYVPSAAALLENERNAEQKRIEQLNEQIEKAHALVTATAKAKAEDEAREERRRLQQQRQPQQSPDKEVPPPPAPHPQPRPKKPQEITGLTALAATVITTRGYKADGRVCERYGCQCDHPSVDLHNAAVHENDIAREIYEKEIEQWGPSWSETMWEQYHACLTTGDEGTIKSLLTKEEMEIMGKCWPKALHLHGELNLLTGVVYEDCKDPNCRMTHNVGGCNKAQLTLMKTKMMDIKHRPRVRNQGKQGYNNQQNEWWNNNNGKRNNGPRKEGQKGKPCPNCKEGHHNQQECDDVKFPKIHEYCWMCGVHGHATDDCMKFRIPSWEKNFEERCETAVKFDRVVHGYDGKPLSGPNKKPYRFEQGRKLKGEGEPVDWTPEQLAIRKLNKETEEAKMKPIAEKIRAKFPKLKPDEA